MDISQQALELGKEALHETADTVGEQLGVKKKKNAHIGAREQFNFWDEFKSQILSNKSPEQIQQDALKAQQGEHFQSPEKMAAARRRLQEVNTPQASPQRPYEYKGPEVPGQQSPQPQQHQGPPVPQRQPSKQPAPSALDYTKQGSNEMVKKMIG